MSHGAALLVALVAGVASWGAVWLLLPWLRSRALDRPNQRSSHTVPTPRGGGRGLLAGAAAGVGVGVLLGGDAPPVVVLAALVVIAGLGLADDLRDGLAPLVRLAIQAVAACAVVWGLGPLAALPLPAPLDLPLGALGWPLTVVWIVAVMNFYNFLDGIDGFAGLQGVVAGAGLAVVLGGGWPGLAALAVAGACAGFLVHNWAPARVFMGDVGSLTVGALLASLPLALGPERAAPAVLATALCLWFFLADGVFTLVRRLLHGEKVWRAHRSHLYQRLVRAGLSHAVVAGAVGGGMVLLSGAAVAAAVEGAGPRVWWWVLAAALAGFAAYWLAVVWCERRGARGRGVAETRSPRVEGGRP